MKKLLTVLFSLLLMIGVVNAEEKVKVYMFEAGGCPYCEREEEYLKSLEGYGKTFELVKKELYVDHIYWEKGKDYEIGKAVAEAFNEAGFEDASYEGTPFVVISDVYAAAAYSDDLESMINLAYEEGDRDVVSCIADGKEDCIRPNTINTLSASASNSKASIVIAIIGGITFVGVVAYVLAKRGNDLEEAPKKVTKEEVEEVEEEEEVVEVKKTTRKPSAKKTTTKKTTKKTTRK